MYKHAIVHPGGAHRDECLALGLAIHAGVLTVEAPVYRREPTDVELDDPGVLVLDVGGRHDPETGCFDHHQLARGTRECALSLLARAIEVPDLGITYHELFEKRPWYVATVVIDSCGPMVMARELGLDKLPRELGSPIEWAVIDSVAESSEVPEWTRVLLAKVMADRASDALELRRRMDWLRANTRLVTLPGELVAVVVDDDKQLGIADYREELVAAGHDVAISVTHDDRGAGWSLYRFNDHPRVDFSALAENEAVLFAHKGGFIAKTRERLPMGAVKALIARALR